LAHLFQPQQPLYKTRIGAAHNPFLAEIALALLGFLCENVPPEGFLEGDLTGGGDGKPLLSTGVRLDLGHFECFFVIPYWRTRTGGALMGPFGDAKV
jgi:hypothetical protein